MQWAGLVTRAHAGEVSRLRLNAYSSAAEFSLTETSFLLWDKIDEASLVCGVWDDKELVATMRVRPLNTMAEATALLEAPAPLAERHLPAVLLDRAATLDRFRTSGHNTWLRRVVLRAARAAGVKRLYGHVFPGAPRVRLLRKMGYEFLAYGRTAGSFVATDTHLLAWLDLPEQGGRAERILASLPPAREVLWMGQSFDDALTSMIEVHGQPPPETRPRKL